jgi:hypothetical protein
LLIVKPGLRASHLESTFSRVDDELSGLEARLARGEALSLASTVEAAIGSIRALLVAWMEEDGKPTPGENIEFLEVFRAFVRGDPSWNAIRDNCRELVYYRNCINMGREDALPPVAERMAVRTARHVYFYMKTRLIRDGRLRE